MPDAGGRFVAGVGVLDPADVDLRVDLGPLHPSSHGALRLALALDRPDPATATVLAAEPQVGHLHRGAEKLFEVRDYRQAVVLANRHDWLAAFGSELGLVLACERVLGMEVPPRAVWLRTLLAEVTRLSACVLLLGTFPGLGPDAPQMAHQARERLLRVVEEATGGRMHVAANRVGGLALDVPAGWTGRVAAALDAVEPAVDALAGLVAAPASVGRLRGLGVLSTADALAHGLTGPVGRASGVDVDLRRDDPVLAYPWLDVPVRLGTHGDVLDRLEAVVDSCRTALALARACLLELPLRGTGDVALPLPKTLRLPVGAVWSWTENPTGALGYYLVSRGQKVPWRLALRTPSLRTASALPALLPGVAVADLAPVLASLFLLLGDLDK